MAIIPSPSQKRLKPSWAHSDALDFHSTLFHPLTDIISMIPKEQKMSWQSREVFWPRMGVCFHAAWAKVTSPRSAGSGADQHTCNKHADRLETASWFSGLGPSRLRCNYILKRKLIRPYYLAATTPKHSQALHACWRVAGAYMHTYSEKNTTLLVGKICRFARAWKSCSLMQLPAFQLQTDTVPRWWRLQITDPFPVITR